MRKPRLNSAVATVAVETVFSLLRVVSLSFVIFFLSGDPSFRDGASAPDPESRDSGFALRAPRNDGVSYSNRPMRFHIQRVDRVAARHVEAGGLLVGRTEICARR